MGPVEELVAERLGPERAAAVGPFAQAYLRRMPIDPADGPSPDALYYELLGAFELAAGRDGAPIAVRAFNPGREQHGYTTLGSVLETNTEDLPFLVDSVTAELGARGLGITRVAHPIVGTRRDASGTIREVLAPGTADMTESVMHFELDRRLAPEELAELEDGVRSVLGDVRRVVGDFPAMRVRLGELVEVARAGATRYDAEEVEEAVAFLQWLERDHFILLGARSYTLADGALGVDAGSGLGLLSDESTSSFAAPVSLAALDPALRDRVGDGELLIVSKTNGRSPVHRRARMDYVGIRRIGAGGEIAGEDRMIGLFTSKAYAEPASQTPVLSRKLTRILAAEQLVAGSHDDKAVRALFDSFPKDELLAAPTADLGRAISALVALRPDQGRLMTRLDADGRTAAIIVALPKARYEAALVARLGALLRERFGAADVTAHEVVGADDDHVRLHYSVHRPEGGLQDVSVRELEHDVLELSRTWDDRAVETLAARHGLERGRILAKRWNARLPRSYKATVAPVTAVDDIDAFERLFTGGSDFHVSLRNAPDGLLTRIGLYRLGAKVELARAMPILEHLGLRVIEELPTRLEGGAGETWLQDFGVLGPGDAVLDLERCGERVAAAITAVWRGQAESDSLNRLVILAGLDWRRIAILRAYRSYRQRIGSRFTEGYQNDVIAANPQLTARLIELFELRFDPAREPDGATEDTLREQILADLEAVPSLDHDRILRNQLGLIDATVRTNAYRLGRRSTAFKLRSADVPAMPQPAPLWEIYVYASEVEGIHLRGGAIARGGLRWSDRMDYRTEVFGLMRAQMTKNAVIVPAGAKGGFYLRAPPADPAALRETLHRGYVTFISGLLDVTDNLVDGAVVHPPDMRVHDADDTYLVVAADKGTATFSDTANQVAARYGFWLGDAFASGGSNGYDHKALGITARGAWESLKRHFSELGLDPATDPFTVVGIGDMSGDVFGNGMLLSDRIRLVAAYDHRHVFIDPEPDAARGHAERRRLFELAGSSWDDYDRAAISPGGGVWPRSAKRIELAPQARAALGVETAQLQPSELIREILRAPVDVLWNGGIGTVVKAAAESDDDARDRAGDAIRVDAADLRCRVVAEGGNLGLTQRARVEFAAGGGLIYADFIDNSAGVDCSDHEVNLKILVDLAVARGRLDREQRDALLQAVTDEVAAHVLYDSFLQAQILAQEARSSAGRMFAYEDLMGGLEAEGLLDRTVEALPSAEQMSERRRAGRGLERPELAVLLAYAKRSLTAALLRSPLLDDPQLAGDLHGYFPAAVTERVGELVDEHPLRRELLATLAANEVVNSLGPTFVSRLVAERGAEPAAVVRAYRIARDVAAAPARWDAIEALRRDLDGDLRWTLMDEADALVEALARWYLDNAPEADVAATIAAGREGFARLAAALADSGAEVWRAAELDEWRAERERTLARLVDRGLERGFACKQAALPALGHTPDVIAVAQATGRSVEDVGLTFALLEAALALNRLEDQLEDQPAVTRVQRWALQAMRDDIWRARRDLAEHALAESPQAGVHEAVATFVASRAHAREQLAAFVRALGADGPPDLAGLTLVVRQLSALAG